MSLEVPLTLGVIDTAVFLAKASHSNPEARTAEEGRVATSNTGTRVPATRWPLRCTPPWWVQSESILVTAFVIFLLFVFALLLYFRV